jgi:hypothetical protein
MIRYREKQVIVDAIQFDCQKHPWPSEIRPWPDENGSQPRDMSFGFIKTRDGRRLHINHGDWIITNVSGEMSLCAPDVFESRYEAIT